MNAESWTEERKLAALMRLPWDVRIARERDGSLVAEVAEIRDAIATGGTAKELAKDLWESLYASLAARLRNEDPIPIPAGRELPWVETPEPAPMPQVKRVVMRLVQDIAPDYEATASDFVLTA